MRSQFRRPVGIIHQVFPAMTTDKMLWKSFTKFQNLTHYLIADMFNLWLKFILLFHFRYLPSKWIIFLQNPIIRFTIWLISEMRWRHELRISSYRVTSFTTEPGISCQEFLPAIEYLFFHIVFLSNVKLGILVQSDYITHVTKFQHFINYHIIFINESIRL